MLHVLLLVVCAVAIYLACEWFVNAVEWLGARLQVGHAAVGTILAAAGTALPESVVTLVAVLFGSASHGDDIAVGAALGGPLVVGTLAYGLTGAVLVVRYRHDRHASAVLTPAAESTVEEDPRAGTVSTTDRLERDQTWFLAIFVVKVGLGLVAFAFKPWLGLAFFAVYAVYFYQEMSGGGERASAEGLEPLRLQPRRDHPSTAAVVVQTLATLTVIFGASHLFVRELEWAGPALGLPAVAAALLISPVATELPEVMNAVIWVRRGKTDLALANLSGAMMIQATIPSGIGLLGTPWMFDGPLLLAGVVTLCAVTYLLWLMRTHRLTPAHLAGTAGFYLVFAGGLAIMG